MRYIENRLQPDVPLFDPDEVSFSVNDTIVDVSIDWIKQIWALSEGVGIPAYAFGEECSMQGKLIPLSD